MRIAHLSDLHFTKLTWNPLRLFSKRAIGHLNWLFLRKKQFFEEQLSPLPALFQELGVDWIFFSGDFSTTSLKKEFEQASTLVSRFQQPWIAVPGNHDRYTKRSCKQKHFYRYFSNAQREIREKVDFFSLEEHRVEARPLGSNWYVVALDTARATNLITAEGFFSEKLEAYLTEALSLLPKDASIILLNHYPFFQNDVPKHNLIRGKALQNLIEKEPRIRLYLHGHTHRHTIADLQVSSLPIVLDSGSAAQGKKGSWNLIDIDEKGCKISTYRYDQEWKNSRIDEFAWKK